MPVTGQEMLYTFNKKTMTIVEFLVLLLIAAICGSIGQSLAGYSLGGCADVNSRHRRGAYASEYGDSKQDNGAYQQQCGEGKDGTPKAPIGVARRAPHGVRVIIVMDGGVVVGLFVGFRHIGAAKHINSG